ncbi:hypothetical protein B0T18DRAFT_210523 [Schizothecium vesticola]|uniref:Uncharacterized protein n=1 Tax=Schizothecium vesticola TaxID=314040 RepID=A0AA40EJJ0_9PEZI|nr:hypothetical protein B0T18DRAFT_210523 [Schizothecium vesticola]
MPEEIEPWTDGVVLGQQARQVRRQDDPAISPHRGATGKSSPITQPHLTNAHCICVRLLISPRP